MDFANVRTESQSGPSSLRGRAGAEARCPAGRRSILQRARHLPAACPWPQRGCQAARAPLLTSASVWQCPRDPCSLASYPDKGANSQLMGIEAGVI